MKNLGLPRTPFYPPYPPFLNLILPQVSLTNLSNTLPDYHITGLDPLELSKTFQPYRGQNPMGPGDIWKNLSCIVPTAETSNAVWQTMTKQVSRVTWTTSTLSKDDASAALLPSPVIEKIARLMFLNRILTPSSPAPIDIRPVAEISCTGCKKPGYLQVPFILCNREVYGTPDPDKLTDTLCQNCSLCPPCILAIQAKPMQENYTLPCRCGASLGVTQVEKALDDKKVPYSSQITISPAKDRKGKEQADAPPALGDTSAPTPSLGVDTGEGPSQVMQEKSASEAPSLASRPDAPRTIGTLYSPLSRTLRDPCHLCIGHQLLVSTVSSLELGHGYPSPHLPLDLVLPAPIDTSATTPLLEVDTGEGPSQVMQDKSASEAPSLARAAASRPDALHALGTLYSPLPRILRDPSPHLYPDLVLPAPTQAQDVHPPEMPDDFCTFDEDDDDDPFSQFHQEAQQTRGPVLHPALRVHDDLKNKCPYQDFILLTTAWDSKPRGEKENPNSLLIHTTKESGSKGLLLHSIFPRVFWMNLRVGAIGMVIITHKDTPPLHPWKVDAIKIFYKTPDDAAKASRHARATFVEAQRLVRDSRPVSKRAKTGAGPPPLPAGHIRIKVVNPQNEPVRLYDLDMDVAKIDDMIEQDDEYFIIAKMPLTTAGSTKNDLCTCLRDPCPFTPIPRLPPPYHLHQTPRRPPTTGYSGARPCALQRLTGDDRRPWSWRPRTRVCTFHLLLYILTDCLKTKLAPRSFRNFGVYFQRRVMTSLPPGHADSNTATRLFTALKRVKCAWSCPTSLSPSLMGTFAGTLAPTPAEYPPNAKTELSGKSPASPPPSPRVTPTHLQPRPRAKTPHTPQSAKKLPTPT